MIALRDHTRGELARKLGRLTEDGEAVSGVLDDFERRGWLSEQRLVEAYVAARGRRYGAQRIEQELKQKGVSASALAEVRPELKAGELAAARAAWRRKFEGPPADARERARQIRWLRTRGFSAETVRRVLGGADEDL